MSEESEILDLIELAATKRSEVEFRNFERLVDLGDRLIAQRIVMDASRNETLQETLANLQGTGSDPTTSAPETNQ